MLLHDTREVWAAYIYALTDSENPLPGMGNPQGYYEVTGEFLRSELRQYQESLVVAVAA